MSRWNVFCNESAPYRIYYRQIEIDGYEMYAMFPLPMTGMDCGWAVSHGATTAATIQEAVQKFYPFMVEYICDKRIPTTIRNNTFSKTSILLATLWIFGAGKMTVNMLLTA